MRTEVSSRALAVLLIALLGAVGLVVVSAPPSPAALGGLTTFAIDGNTEGPDDWDDPPATLLDLSVVSDACGNGVLDPTTLDGKLEDLDLGSLEPVPGTVPAKADICRAWLATEAVARPDGGMDIVVYGAWERFSANGEAVGYWTLEGPAAGPADDYLIEFDDAGVRILGWDGSDWTVEFVPDVGDFEVAYDDPEGALFAEFAVNLSAVGVPGLEECVDYVMVGVLTRTGNDANAQLEDWAGLGEMEVSACGTLVLRKMTTPASPDPAASFGYLVERDLGGDVVPGDDQASGTLTVPGASMVVIEDVLAGSDYLLTETSMPDGWVNESIVCTFVDPRSGSPSVGGRDATEEFTVAPGRVTSCTITNLGPPTLTIVKAAVPDDGTEFTFDVERVPSEALPSLTLASGESGQIEVEPGDEITVTEQAVADWALARIVCVGDDDAVTDATSATLTVDAGEQILCVFLNESTSEPQPATIVVAKRAPDPEGTEFGFTVDGPGADPGSFSLAPDDVALEVVQVEPDVLGSTYTVAESGLEGWELTGLVCESPSGQSVDLESGTATLGLLPTETAACVFTNRATEPPARLTLAKTSDPAGEGPFGFWASGVSPRLFTLSDGESRVFEELDPGSYRFAELVPEGWTSMASCDNGTVATDGNALITLVPGDDVTCTVANTALASLTLTKDSQPQSSQRFTFAIAHASDAAGTVVLDDDGDEADDADSGAYPSSVTGTSLPAGVWTLTETAVDGWTVSDISCEGGTVVSLDVAARTVQVDIPAGGSAECTFVNTMDDAGGGGGEGGAGGEGELADSGFLREDLAVLSLVLLVAGLWALRVRAALALGILVRR